MTGADGSPLKLLLVGLNYAPEPVGIAPYSTGLCETLAGWGHQVEAVVGEAYYPQWRRYEGQPATGVRLVENGVGVTRCRHYVPAKPNGLHRILHLLSFSLTALIPSVKRARAMRPDIVFAVAPSLLSVPVAWIAARASGAKLWIHVQDFEVEAAFATGLLEQKGLLARTARWIENRVLALGDRISTISPQMVARLAAKGLPPARCYELRNWANTDFAPDAEEAARYRAEWGLGDCKVALYSGNIANKQGIEIVIEAARLLRARDDIAFVICGQGPNRERLTALSADLPNVQLHDLQPAGRMGGLLSLATVHLLPQIPGAADLMLPSKMTNMLVSGRPVVATAAGGTGIATELDGCGIVTAPGDADAFAAAIAQVCDSPQAAAQMGRCAADRAAERWNQQAILTRVLVKFRELAPQRPIRATLRQPTA